MSVLRVHKLKTWPALFAAVKRNFKTCEVRKADRDYRVGDVLMLLEFDPQNDRYHVVMSIADAPSPRERFWRRFALAALAVIAFGAGFGFFHAPTECKPGNPHYQELHADGDC